MSDNYSLSLSHLSVILTVSWQWWHFVFMSMSSMAIWETDPWLLLIHVVVERLTQFSSLFVKRLKLELIEIQPKLWTNSYGLQLFTHRDPFQRTYEDKFSWFLPHVPSLPLPALEQGDGQSGHTYVNPPISK